MKTTMKTAIARGVSSLVLVTLLGACSDDATAGTLPLGGNGNTPAPSTDRIDAAAISACPRSETLLKTADWIACLAGRSVAGTEPFGGAPCELRIGEGGAFEYVRSGAVVLSVPPRASWGKAAFGTYQNDGDAFIAGVSPDLPLASGAATLQNLRMLFAGRGVSDNLEVDYLDATKARATYACRVEVL